MLSIGVVLSFLFVGEVVPAFAHWRDTSFNHHANKQTDREVSDCVAHAFIARTANHPCAFSYFLAEIGIR
jgi:hypothetical protein